MAMDMGDIDRHEFLSGMVNLVSKHDATNTKCHLVPSICPETKTVMVPRPWASGVKLHLSLMLQSSER